MLATQGRHASRTSLEHGTQLKMWGKAMGGCSFSWFQPNLQEPEVRGDPQSRSRITDLCTEWILVPADLRVAVSISDQPLTSLGRAPGNSVDTQSQRKTRTASPPYSSTVLLPPPPPCSSTTVPLPPPPPLFSLFCLPLPPPSFASFIPCPPTPVRSPCLEHSE